MSEHKSAAYAEGLINAGEQNAIIWATNEIPLTAWLGFPPTFTASDKARTWEALRAIYEDVVNRKAPE